MALEDQKRSKPLQQGVRVPTEIVHEILLRLPVVSLLRCKCVCKLWFSLISDPYFVKGHVKSNEYAHHHRRLILTTEARTNIKSCHLCDVLLHDKLAAAAAAVNNHALETDYPFKHHAKYVSVVGSCNGLLCLRIWGSRDYYYCIWNPGTRRSSKRFSRSFDSNVRSNSNGYGFGFGYDESTDDYKLVEFFRPLKSDTSTTHIYSLKSGNWNKFSQFFRGSLWPCNRYGTFSNGALHWLVEKFQTNYNGHYLRTSVVSFDLASETYGEISHPPYDEGFDVLNLGALGEWLCVLCNYRGKRGDLWVMKVYGATNSWIKLYSIPYPTDFMLGYLFYAPLCILDDGKLLLRLGWTLVLYDSKNGSFSEIQSFDKWCNAITLVESLVSPDPQ